MDWSLCITYLESLGWTLVGLGRAVGLSPQGISDIKQRRTKAPSGMAAVRLHRLYEAKALPPEEGQANEPIPQQEIARG